jgi:hypothetical protein
MSLDRAIIIATEALRMDQLQAFPHALQLYVDACDELLKVRGDNVVNLCANSKRVQVVKAEPDPARKKGLSARMISYLQRAEEIKFIQRQQKAAKAAAARPPAPPPGPATAPDARSRTSTAQSYFLPDDRFLADVAKAKQIRAQVEGRFGTSKEQWVDQTFLPGKPSLVGPWTEKPEAKALCSKVAQWTRPSAQEPDAGGVVPWTVFGECPSPKDIDQGRLGDCWFLSAVSVLSFYPELVRRLLVTTTYRYMGVVFYAFISPVWLVTMQPCRNLCRAVVLRRGVEAGHH